jgi:prophage regulatory protein
MAHQHNISTDWVRSSELQSIVPYSLNHIRRLEAAGSFPKRVRLGANRVAWIREEVAACVSGGGKVRRGSGGIIPLRAV